jgi:molybdopterin-containing oxidoreductase family iron-sulfur binding subunit
MSATPANTERTMWRSIEELAGSEKFEDFVRREYPSQIHKFMDPPQRRDFLKLMGASLALAGATASCTRQPAEHILPYAKSPESTIPGRPRYYATAMPWPTGALGLLIESHMGRPTKVEGNPDHPASLGAADAFAQAAVLGLYDPDRSHAITHRGRIGTWDELLTELKAALNAQQAKSGAGLRVLTETVTSPTLAQQMKDLLAAYPKARWHQYEPLNQDNARGGAMLAFDRDVACQHRFDLAEVIVSLDADFLGAGPASVRPMREFTSRRKARAASGAMNRLYVVESTPSITGAMADHRGALRASDVEAFARRLAGRLDVNVGEEPGSEPRSLGDVDSWIDALARDLEKHTGSSLVLAGDAQPPVVHALAHALNDKLGNVGRTVRYTQPLASESVDQMTSLRELVDEMRAGTVDCLVILGGNPVYSAPGELKFGDALRQVSLTVRLGLHDDETSNLCDWHVNEAHFLESWSDTRASDGTVSIVQPLIAPLYGGRSAHELVATLANQSGASSYDLVRAHWRGDRDAEAFEVTWRTALHDGTLPETAHASVNVELRKIEAQPSRRVAGLELAFRPDPTLYDGRFANNGWLQELPKPLSKLTWDNAAFISPTTAAKLGVATGDVVRLRCDGRSVNAPVWVQPGQADECVVVHFGFGRSRAGALGSHVGFDAHALRAARSELHVGGLEIERTGASHRFASTQEHDNMEGRDIVRVATIDRFREHPTLVEHPAHGSDHSTSMFPPQPGAANAWGMVIDLNACTACGACVTACQSENNIPVVGKKEIERGREMHWLRIDRYFEGKKENPAVHFQPIPCMHCENAPCEIVCPVGATTHSPEGLNEMTYNRCVGTRYCANNCPYKVRRFNFFLYSDFATESLKLQRNPDVSVRSRGVMEKCTYCVQRISEARIQAAKEDRPIRDGDVRTACQATCPAEAIVFGDINDPKSAVSKLKTEPHNYGLLEELNTKPRTTYLAKITNPNPEIAERT